MPSAAETWPKEKAKDLGYQFNGYHLDAKRRPTFLYTVKGIQISDEPAPKGEAGAFVLQRTFAFKAGDGDVPADLQFRAAIGDKIEAVDGGYKIDDACTLRITSGQKAIVRQSSGKSELLIPVELKDRQAKLVVEYDY